MFPLFTMRYESNNVDHIDYSCFGRSFCKWIVLCSLFLTIATCAWSLNNYAAFRIESDPSGATVTVMQTNQYLGTTPTVTHTITINPNMGYCGLTMGQWFDLLIRKQGYYDQFQRIFVPFNKSYRDYAVKSPQVFKFILYPIPLYYYPQPIIHFPSVPSSNWDPFYKTSSDVSSDPSDAAVYVDDEYYGQTPCNIELLWSNNSVKKKILRVEKSGYASYQKAIDSYDRRIHVVLQPTTGRRH